MNKFDRPILAMLNYLDEPSEADAFVALIIDDARSPAICLSGYEVCRAKADLGELANLKGRDATRTTAETLVGSFQHDDHEEALSAAVALCHFTQNSYLVVHATLGDDGEITTISLKALKAPDFQSANDLLQDYATAMHVGSRKAPH